MCPVPLLFFKFVDNFAFFLRLAMGNEIDVKLERRMRAGTTSPAVAQNDANEKG
jgi:hypothetical protein